MKKTTAKKLNLKAETVRNLGERELRGAAGGFGSTACTNPTLWSDCCPRMPEKTIACEY